MTWEAMQTLSPGRSVTVRLIPAKNRVVVEPSGNVTAEEIGAALPRLLGHLATRSGLPVRYAGKVFRPGPRMARDADEWGTP